jgi:hypothetical protein
MIFKSRKFWAAVAALLLAILQGYMPDFPLEQAQFEQLVLVLAAYIVGTGIEDGLKARG